MEKVTIEKEGSTMIIGINRSEKKNAIDSETAAALNDAFTEFEFSDSRVAVITGIGDSFSAGADLNDADALSRRVSDGNGPLGITRRFISKPVIAAISGYCVAGGLELALWADIRVADETAKFGFLERRYGIPLIDGGTQRLPLIIGLGRALDLIMTGRLIQADEAFNIGLVNYIVKGSDLLKISIEIAEKISSYPWKTLLRDRWSVYLGLGNNPYGSLTTEAVFGRETVDEGIVKDGSEKFRSGVR